MVCQTPSVCPPIGEHGNPPHMNAVANLFGRILATAAVRLTRTQNLDRMPAVCQAACEIMQMLARGRNVRRIEFVDE